MNDEYKALTLLTRQETAKLVALADEVDRYLDKVGSDKKRTPLRGADQGNRGDDDVA
jgi:hypothetical protein